MSQPAATGPHTATPTTVLPATLMTQRQLFSDTAVRPPGRPHISPRASMYPGVDVPPTRPRRRSTVTSAGPTRPGVAGDRTSFYSEGGAFSDEWLDDEYDDELEPEFEHDPDHTRSRKKKQDEPMSPVVVVRELERFPTIATRKQPPSAGVMGSHANMAAVYVVFFYVVWQILTRSDESEILGHLPTTSPLLGPHAMEQQHTSPSPLQQAAYQLPYALPQLPSAVQPKTDASSSTWRIVLASIIYPVYLAITLVAIPLPFLLQAFNLILNVLSTILYPITSTARLLTRTFVLAPLGVVGGFLQALYPVYVFVGGVVGVGTFLGVAMGWIGRVVLSVLVGRKASSSRRRRSSRRSKKHSSAPTTARPSHHRERRPSYEYEYERRYVPIVDVVALDDDLVDGQVRGTAREAVVLGLRRRGAIL